MYFLYLFHFMWIFVRLLRFVVLVFASHRLFGVEFTPFGGMLVVGVTVTISRSGFRLL